MVWPDGFIALAVGYGEEGGVNASGALTLGQLGAGEDVAVVGARAETKVMVSGLRSPSAIAGATQIPAGGITGKVLLHRCRDVPDVDMTGVQLTGCDVVSLGLWHKK